MLQLLVVMSGMHVLQYFVVVPGDSRSTVDTYRVWSKSGGYLHNRRLSEICPLCPFKHATDISSNPVTY